MPCNFPHHVIPLSYYSIKEANNAVFERHCASSTKQHTHTLCSFGKRENVYENGGQNKTCLALVADETASAHFQLWNEECDAFHTGDILHLSKGIVSYNRSNLLVLRAGKRVTIEKVGEFAMEFVESPNMSEIVGCRSN